MLYCDLSIYLVSDYKRVTSKPGLLVFGEVGLLVHLTKASLSWMRTSSGFMRLITHALR